MRTHRGSSPWGSEGAAPSETPALPGGHLHPHRSWMTGPHSLTSNTWALMGHRAWGGIRVCTLCCTVVGSQPPRAGEAQEEDWVIPPQDASPSLGPGALEARWPQRPRPKIPALPPATCRFPFMRPLVPSPSHGGWGLVHHLGCGFVPLKV